MGDAASIKVINSQIVKINTGLSWYKSNVGGQINMNSDNNVKCPPWTAPHGVTDSLIADGQTVIADLDYTSKVKELDARESTTGKANAAYKQSEQSSMLYNLSVSALVNIISGILILIFFIGKELGLSIKNIAKTAGAVTAVKKANDSLTKKTDTPDTIDSNKDSDKDSDKDKTKDKTKDKDKAKASDTSSKKKDGSPSPSI